MRQAGLFGLSDHLKRLSANGDPLEILDRVIGFESFRPILTASLAYGDGSRGGRPAYDPVAMLKVLILAAQNNVSDGRMEYLISGPSELAAVFGLRAWRATAGREHDPAVPREIDCGGGA